jgi:hypothetical protein
MDAGGVRRVGKGFGGDDAAQMRAGEKIGGQIWMRAEFGE